MIKCVKNYSSELKIAAVVLAFVGFIALERNWEEGVRLETQKQAEISEKNVLKDIALKTQNLFQEYQGQIPQSMQPTVKPVQDIQRHAENIVYPTTMTGGFEASEPSQKRNDEKRMEESIGQIQSQAKVILQHIQGLSESEASDTQIKRIKVRVEQLLQVIQSYEDL